MPSVVKTPDGKTHVVGAGCKHWKKQLKCRFTRSICADCPAKDTIMQLRVLDKQGVGK